MTMPSQSALDTSSQRQEIASPSLFRNRNYLRFWASAAISSLGDFFTLIAMPWLVLALTKDPAALGMVMALESLPRAAFMLVSGGFTDRYTPRTVLIVSRALFLVTLVVLAVSLLRGHMQIQQLYGFAFVFGLLTAFALPADAALLPQLVGKEQIQQGNSALMGTRQLVQLFAPVLAGLLIWGMPSPTLSSSDTDLSRIAYAFLFNAAAIFVALLVLLRIKLVPRNANGEAHETRVRLADGFRYLWRDQGLRIVTLYMACICFFAIGPLLTVIPQFAAQRLDDGALSYGMLYAVNGLGALIGFACGGLLPKPGGRNLGLVMFAAYLMAGACVLWFGRSTSFAMAAPALALIGVTSSYAGVVGLSWIQQRIPSALSGRVLGLVMFAMMGLTPVSMALSGVVAADYSLTVLLSLSGCAIGGVALLGLVFPGINRFGTYPNPVLPEAT